MFSRPLYVLIGALLVLAATAGCSGPFASELDPKGALTAHYLLVHADGYALNSKFEGLRTEDLDKALDATVLRGIKKHINHLKREPNGPCGDTLRLLIFVHGGLNTYAGSFERMENMLGFPDIPYTCYYPVFVNWDSGLLSSIGDDLFRLRFGRPSWAFGVVTSPVVIAGRLVGSLADLPMALMHNGDSVVEAAKGAREQGDPMYCIVGDALLYLPLQGLYVGTIPLVEGFGRPAWDIMKRRAQLAVASRLVDGPDEWDVYMASGRRYMKRFMDQAEVLALFNEGAVLTLARRLKERIQFDGEEWFWVTDKKKASEKIDYNQSVRIELTLVGHSMGSMLLNRFLSVLDSTEQATRDRVPFPVKQIIYMAPAASVDELEDFIVPYLEYNQEAKFSMFVLNRRDETREIPYGGAVFFMPRGSLLAWIDTFLESEASIGQATSGRMRNLREYYSVKDRPGQRGTANCFTPSWPDTAATLPPDQRPIKDQYRRLLANAPKATTVLQDNGRFSIYESPARINDHTVPSEHGDFTEPHFFLEVLCHVDGGAFRNRDVCSGTPYWLNKPPWYKFWVKDESSYKISPLFERVPLELIRP